MRSIKAERTTVAMKSVREDSVEHLFQPGLSRALGGPDMTEGLPEIPSVAELDIHEPCTPACHSAIRRLSRLS